MDAIANKFEKMGARLKVRDVATLASDRRFQPISGAVRINILRDKRGEYFDLQRRTGAEVQVVDVCPRDRHLLLHVNGDGAKSKFLCGHDERAWFVAAVPEKIGVRDVQTAKDALKPRVVLAEMRRQRVRAKDRDRRHTDAFVRQGEWFFVPRPRLTFDALRVFRNEPIRRGNGKPHVCESLCRVGGVQVWVSRRYPNGLTAAEFEALPESQRKHAGFRVMQRDAQVYVKGTVRHPDHKTIVLPGWHLVAMNTETQAAAMRHVAFLD